MFTDIPVPLYLINEHYGDRFFDVIDAFEEAKHIYFEGSRVFERLKPGTPFIIGETGFGVGRVLLSLLHSLENSGMKNLDITYNSVELHPLTSERISLILDSFREKAGTLIEKLVEAYRQIDITKQGWHITEITGKFGKITLNLWIGEALEMVRALKNPCDAWFLDGHGPKKNPEIWRTELLKAVGEKTKTGGTFATFTVAVAINRDLTEAGFMTEQFPGHGRKRAVLRGVRINDEL